MRTRSGIGIDIVEIKRFRDLPRASREAFLARTFTSRERAYCEKGNDPAIHYAGTFAAKEAIFKAAGGTGMLAYEIRRKQGKPEVWRSGKRLTNVLVSISHTRDIAIAIALAQ